MTATGARWVLFLALLIVLPWPFFVQQQWSWLPVAYLLPRVGSAIFNGSAPVVAMLGLIQLAVALVVFWGVARLYVRCSATWPVKFRGSIVGLLALTLLMIFSSVAVYGPLELNGIVRVTFLDVYQ
ncbi:MAG: hypothetical protein WCY88_11090 [Spongiibacteraceae bacterium]